MTPVELLQELIRFDTTNPPGAERECVERIGALLSEEGVEWQTYAATPERPNLVARLPGGPGPGWCRGTSTSSRPSTRAGRTRPSAAS